MHAPKSQKSHARASLTGMNVPSIWLPNPGGTVTYIAGGPASATLTSLSQGSPSATPTPSRKRKRGAKSLPRGPHPSNMPGSHDAEDQEIAHLLTEAFRLLSDSVSQLSDSENKNKLTNILASFSALLLKFGVPVDGDENSTQQH
ncbi:hypothetical protein JVT61DRAFT_11817 [Boletus reticuloceps]|uniref:Uncharacterized protein n=1 Tax=Boletus reticuloceps TaxID=495285 RepID=A0A8I2YU93_9AGAM|nr:hypothetical protein JVT61DRAFT_11817 [Boletus reticuloceps]